MPSIDVNCYLIEFRARDGSLNFMETETGQTFDQAVVAILTGQVDRPTRVVSFNTAEGWAHEVTEDVAREVANRVRDLGHYSDGLISFIEENCGSELADEVRSQAMAA